MVTRSALNVNQSRKAKERVCNRVTSRGGPGIVFGLPGQRQRLGKKLGGLGYHSGVVDPPAANP
jgi:hypothetical protein